MHLCILTHMYTLLICFSTDTVCFFKKFIFSQIFFIVNYTILNQQTNHFSIDYIKIIPLPFGEHWLLFDFLRVKLSLKKKSEQVEKCVLWFRNGHLAKLHTCAVSASWQSHLIPPV